MTSTRRRLHDERGAAAVEFALVVTILLLLLFGVFEFGRVFSQLEVLNGAAREGARVAAVRGTAAEVQAATNTAAEPYELSEPASVDKTCDDDTSGEPVTVSWTQHVEVSIAILPTYSQDINITGVFRCE